MPRAASLDVVVLLALAGCTSDEPDDRTTSPETAAATADLTPCPGPSDAGPAADGFPDLTLDCLGGGTLDLSQAPGVPTLVNLWASWCGPCREELPLLQQLSETAGDQVRVLGVDSQDGRSQGVSFATDAGLTFPLAFDGDGVLAAELGLRGLRHTLFLASDGSVVHVESGGISSGPELCGLVAEHLAVQL